MDRPLFFLRLSRRACLARTHFALAIASLQKRKKGNARYAGLLTGGKPVQKVEMRGFLLLKLAFEKELKGLCQATCFN